MSQKGKQYGRSLACLAECIKSLLVRLILHILTWNKWELEEITFIKSRLYLRTFCDIRLDTEHIKVTGGHQMNLVLTVSMHNYS